MYLPKIDSLQISAPNGNKIRARLPLGGFGISRYVVDHLLANIALKEGVMLLEETKVEAVTFNNHFQLQFVSDKTESTSVIASVCCGSFGKRSNLDVKWKRSFISKKDPRINNYIGVKYHVKTEWPEQLIGLHNFKDGYCGISKIEEDKYCLCYLTTADNLKKCNGSIEKMQQEVLYQNPLLKQIFQEAQFVEGFPLTIAQISFNKKTQVENHVLMLGDSAGMIAPLCGNGMSMALHSSKMAATLIAHFLRGNISRSGMEKGYENKWQKTFAGRLATGRLLQRFFGSKRLSNSFVRLFQLFPFLTGTVIKQTHGEPF
jgi:flavin-dependent dehydrogenase